MRLERSSVRFTVYQGMLKRASRLIPAGVSVCFLADRGNASTQLMRYLRSGVALAMSGFASKATLGFIAPRKAGNNSTTIIWRRGKVWYSPGVTLTLTHPLEHLNLALGRDPLSGQLWLVATDEPACLVTFREYAQRFQIEEELQG